MLSIESLAAFLALSIVITFAPGPDNLMVLGQSLARGPRAGFGIALGCALGCFTHTLWATLGVSALLLASPNAFFALKLAGAAYLCWLGVQALRSGAGIGAPAEGRARPLPWRRYVARGFIANAINPKVALFFLAFLPQFAQPAHGAVQWQMVTLGSVFAVQTVLVFGAIAYAAGRIGAVLARRPRLGPWLDRVAGVIFIGLAVNLLLAGRQN
ncbi:MAG TPA: LysE family translocator [Rhodocyclaceae bacterium]|nr:LysE family translocator [Rhodocyclaceae bacterium]